jgi:nitroreductase
VLDLDLILTRQSPLTLRAPGPDDVALRAMLAAGMCGPDHGRLTPWRFTVIEGDGRQAFGRVLREALRLRVVDADDAMLAREEAKALRAPTIVIVTVDTRRRAGDRGRHRRLQHSPGSSRLRPRGAMAYRRTRVRCARQAFAGPRARYVDRGLSLPWYARCDAASARTCRRRDVRPSLAAANVTCNVRRST